MAVVTAKLAARAGARGVADASLGNGTRLTSGLSAVGPGWGVGGGRLFLSSDYFFQRKHGRRGTKSKSKKEEEIKQERWRSATRETPSACSGGNEAFPERELCHLQGRAMWITTQKRRNADRGGVHAESAARARRTLALPKCRQGFTNSGTSHERCGETRVRPVGNEMGWTRRWRF